MNSKVDEYLSNTDTWQQEMQQLRRISLGCGLTETVKWGKPCYTFQKSNIAIIQPFKETCALMFFKGCLLDDPNDVLEKPGKNSRIARRISFTSVEEIAEMESILKAYIKEAIEVEKAGIEPKPKKKTESIPKELQAKMDENAAFQKAFESLTPGRQRGYLLYFSGAKQSKTRERRVEKYVQKIIEGKGLRE